MGFQIANGEMIVEAFVEIPAGGQNKYEFDKESGVFRLDRTLYSPVHYPTEYGFIPDTLSDDGDPIDIMVMVTIPTFPGCMIRTRIIGALEMVDDQGLDVKLLGLATADPRMNQIRCMDDVPRHITREIEFFFTIYKELENKPTEVRGWKGLDYAEQKLTEAYESYRGETDGE